MNTRHNSSLVCYQVGGGHAGRIPVHRPGAFSRGFAADLPAAQAEFMADSQMPASVKAMQTPITVPAWKSKPSWYAVAGADRMINPDLERMYAKRANSYVIEVPGASHSVYISHATRIAALIEEAAQQAGKQ